MVVDVAVEFGEAENRVSEGLTSAEATSRLRRDGANELPASSSHAGVDVAREAADVVCSPTISRPSSRPSSRAAQRSPTSVASSSITSPTTWLSSRRSWCVVGRDPTGRVGTSIVGGVAAELAMLAVFLPAIADLLDQAGTWAGFGVAVLAVPAVLAADTLQKRLTAHGRVQ